MSETYQQMRRRHEEEIRIATEQHAIRMQAMKERHFSEMMQVANPGGERDAQRGEEALRRTIL